MNVGERIKELREKKNISNTELAKYCGLDQSAMSRIERNERKVDMLKLEKICEVLDITLADFFEKESKKYQNLSNDLIELIKCAEKLTPEQLEKLTSFIGVMLDPSIK